MFAHDISLGKNNAEYNLAMCRSWKTSFKYILSWPEQNVGTIKYILWEVALSWNSFGF